MARHERDLKQEQIWRQRLDGQRASGQTTRIYCERHGFAETAFHYWRRTTAKRDRVIQAVSRPAFVPSPSALRSILLVLDGPP
ncbi:MAG TPA: hypothetical protein VHR66_02835 [Gemmataceae bacterium]|nr:hypothetical protein [Gemmataceae bacterium]